MILLGAASLRLSWETTGFFEATSTSYTHILSTVNHYRCVRACPAGYVYRRETRYSTNPNNIEYACYRECSSTQVLTPENYCESSCPTGYIADGNKKCQHTCSTSEFYDPDQSGTNKCVALCLTQPLNTFTISTTRTCVSRCPSHLPYYDASTKVCTDTCPNYRTVRGECVTTCLGTGNKFS